MRRILAGLTATVAVTGTLMVLPVYAAPTPEPVPVQTSSETVDLGSVTDPAPAADVQEGTTDPVAGVAETAPTLTVTRTGVAPFSLVGVTWAFDPRVTDTLVQVRVQDADGAWGTWTEVGAETADQGAAAPTGTHLRGGTSPLWTGESTGVEVELVTRAGAQPADVQLDLVDPGSSDADDALGAPAITDTADAALAMPPVFSRDQWGADDSIRTWDPQYATTIKAATLHHTADTNDYTADDVPAMMRSIYRYHTVSLGWGDIGYNVVVDKFGRMFEGRYGGLASTVVGAHAGGFNTSTFGVSMLGNYELVDTPQVMIDAVSSIIAWKFSLFGIDPQGTTTLTSAGGGTSRYTAGTKVTLPTIFGHRDVGSTACPGRYGYAKLPGIRAAVAAQLASPARLVQDRYDSDAALRTRLGAATSAVTRTPDGRGAFAHYANGSLYATLATGAHVLGGAVRDKWAALGWERSPLGYPTSDDTPTPDGRGSYAQFEKASIYATGTTGAHVLGGAVRDKWAALGWERSPLGYPTSDLTTIGGGAQFVHFSGGSVYWSAATGAHVVSGAVREAWAAGGWENGTLGLPTTDVAGTPDGAATFAHFQGGSVYATAAYGAHRVGTAIRDRWAASGWERGPLGYPRSDQAATPGGAAQFVSFAGGAVYSAAATGTRLLTGGVLDAYTAAAADSGTLGLPTTDVGTTPDGAAQYAHFTGGSVYAGAAIGTHVLGTAVRDAWARSGWERGPLGYPAADAAATPAGGSAPSGVVQQFQHGAVYVSDPAGAHAVSAGFTAALAVGGGTAALGYPVADAATTPDRTGEYQHFGNGSVYGTASFGAHAVPLVVRDVWSASGWEKGPLGYPTADVVAPAAGGSVHQDFQGGSVYWSRGTGGHLLRGPIRDAWIASGGERGALGLPTSDVTGTPDRTGAYAYFTGGAIYWSAPSGARVLRGAVLDAWGRSGWERGPLGYPVGDQASTPDGLGSYAHFQGGSLYATAATGAHLLPTVVRDAWARTGWERGPLGYPTSDPTPVAGGTRTSFQRGSITVAAGSGAVTVALG